MVHLLTPASLEAPAHVCTSLLSPAVAHPSCHCCQVLPQLMYKRWPLLTT